MQLARGLGSVFAGPDMDSELPVVVTEPASDAPDWRPFDRPDGIGWHNDFSTLTDRPVLSLAWIARPDPRPGCGGWRAASCSAVLERLERDPEMERLCREPLPFGYLDGGSASFLPLIAPLPENPNRNGLRYYGRALREGACVTVGDVPTSTLQLIERIEGAADAVGETLEASAHALLVCHNGLGLHDRTQQTAASPLPLRKSILCFVSRIRGQGLRVDGPDGQDEGGNGT